MYTTHYCERWIVRTLKQFREIRCWFNLISESTKADNVWLKLLDPF